MMFAIETKVFDKMCITKAIQTNNHIVIHCTASMFFSIFFFILPKISQKDFNIWQMMCLLCQELFARRKLLYADKFQPFQIKFDMNESTVKNWLFLLLSSSRFIPFFFSHSHYHPKAYNSR